MKLRRRSPLSRRVAVPVLRPMNSSLAAKIAAKQLRRHRRTHTPEGHRSHQVVCHRRVAARLGRRAQHHRVAARAHGHGSARRGQAAAGPRHRGDRPGHQPRPQSHRRAVGFVRRRGAGPAGTSCSWAATRPRAAIIRTPSRYSISRPPGLLAAAEALRNGKDYAGNALHGTPELFLGATANPGAPEVRSRSREHAPQDRRRREDAADPGHLSRRSAQALHRCREAGWRRGAGRHHSAQVREERPLAERESAGRGRAGGHARGHGAGGEGRART